MVQARDCKANMGAHWLKKLIKTAVDLSLKKIKSFYALAAVEEKRLA
jgi:hypothetical protein